VRVTTSSWLKPLAIVIAVIIVVGATRHTIYVPHGHHYVSSALQAEELYKLAIARHDSRICGDIVMVGGSDSFDTSAAQSRCYSTYVETFPDKNICPPADQGCLASYAESSDSPEVCFQAKQFTQLCIMVISDRYHDPSACERLSIHGLSDEGFFCKSHYAPY
jgi:hypothetical protein